MPFRIRSIHLPPAPGGGAAAVEVDAVEVRRDGGVRTPSGLAVPADFLSFEVFQAMCRELSLLGAQPARLGRVFLTEGVNLAEYVGRPFTVQGVAFFGEALLPPQPDWDRLYCAGAAAWFTGRAGLRARVLADGWIHRTSGEAPKEKTSGQRLAETWPEHEWD